MTIKVYLQERFERQSLSVFVVNEHEGWRRILQSGDGGGMRWDELPHVDSDIGDEPAQPTFRFPYDIGRPLLEALVRHYNGAEDTRALRRDYDNERKRVDEQAKVIGDIARLLAGGTHG
jgi:hypothetical protein